MSNRKPSFIDRVRSFIWRNWEGQVLIGPQDPVPPSSLALVTREYLRACSERGRGPHIEGEDLARAAAVYASPDRLVVEHTGMSPWPWPERCDEINQLTRVEQLTRAAVLCMREIDRLRKGGGVAQDHFAGGGKMVETEPNGHPTDADLVKGAVRNAGYLITDGEVPRWAAVRDTFAVGSSSAFHLCRRFCLDPDAMVGCFVEVEEEEREHIGLSSDVCESCGRVSCSFECPERTAIEKELKEGGGEPAQVQHGSYVTPPPVGKAGGERAPLTVRELIAALSKMNPYQRALEKGRGTDPTDGARVHQILQQEADEQQRELVAWKAKAAQAEQSLAETAQLMVLAKDAARNAAPILRLHKQLVAAAQAGDDQAVNRIVAELALVESPL